MTLTPAPLPPPSVAQKGYYANAVLFAYLWVFPHSPGLFRVAFAFANGPLLFAVAAFRNSLVYHSIDHITSLWLHISPAFTTWALRHAGALS